MIEFVVGRYTLPYHIESRDQEWRGVAVLLFKQNHVFENVLEGRDGRLWLWIRAEREGKIISYYLVDYLTSHVKGEF